MRTLILVVGAALAAVAPALADPPAPPTAETRLFELREYFAAPGKLDELHARFRKDTVRFLEKHGITSVSYFTTADDDGSKLCAILAYPDAAARQRSWAAFVTDPEWQRARRAADANGRLVEKIREHPLTPTADCPGVKVTPIPGARYELQSLTIPATEVASACERLCRAPHSANATVVGCWTSPVPGSPGEVRVVRLVARPPAPPASTRPVVFQTDPVSPIERVIPSKPVEPPDGVTVLAIKPTDYSPIK